MEASLWPYCAGAIVEYSAPFNKNVCCHYGILSSHLVMILNEAIASPSGRYQCFMLSSKIDGYFGYKVYVNTANPKFKGLGLVNTTEVYTIDHRYLGKILGFVPRQFVEKCRHAYAYEIGLSTEIPQYYKNDANAFGWLTAGEPAQPMHPKVFSPNGVLQEYDIATAYHQMPDEIRTIHPEVRPIINPADVENELHTDNDAPALDTNENASANEAKPVDNISNGTHDSTENDSDIHNDTPEPEHHTQRYKTQKPVDPMVQKVRAMRTAFSHRSKDAVMTHEFHEYLQQRSVAMGMRMEPLNEKLRLTYNTLSDGLKYECYMEKVHMSDLIKKGYCKDAISARKIVNRIIADIDKEKADLINGVLTRRIDLRFIMDRRILAYRCLTIDDIHDMHMGIATYDNYAKSYQLDPADTYIGEMRRGELI